MSNSKATAEKIVERLESMTDRGFKRTFGGLKRKEFAAIVSDLADIIDGKELPAYVVPEKKPKAEAKPAGGGAKPAASKPIAGGKPAQA
jgi:hypothetical protein